MTKRSRATKILRSSVLTARGGALTVHVAGVAMQSAHSPGAKRG
jgi:hypothetical protein